MEDNFQLIIDLEKEYRFQVEVYHRSEQVLRFHLVAPDLQLKLEKRLLTKTQPWKLLATSKPLTHDHNANHFNRIVFYLNQEIKGGVIPSHRYQQPYTNETPILVGPEKLNDDCRGSRPFSNGNMYE